MHPVYRHMYIGIAQKKPTQLANLFWRKESSRFGFVPVVFSWRPVPGTAEYPVLGQLTYLKSMQLLYTVVVYYKICPGPSEAVEPLAAGWAELKNLNLLMFNATRRVIEDNYGCSVPSSIFQGLDYFVSAQKGKRQPKEGYSIHYERGRPHIS